MKTLVILIAVMLIASPAFAITDGSQGELVNGEGEFLYHYSVGSGSTAYDYSGNAADGNINNLAWGAGMYGNGLYFDGDPFNDFTKKVDVPTIVGGDRTKLLLQAWVKLDEDKPGNHDIFEADSVLYLRIQTEGSGATLYGQVFDGGNRLAIGTTTIPTGVWTHVALAYDGTGETRFVGVYVNGVLDGASNYIGAGGALDGRDLHPIIGDNHWPDYSWSIGRNFKGSMDDIQLVFGDTLATVPEPSMLALLGLLGLIKRKK
jgi:Concanavalin A-like lectin/glucanases superfamily